MYLQNTEQNETLWKYRIIFLETEEKDTEKKSEKRKLSEKEMLNR